MASLFYFYVFILLYLLLTLSLYIRRLRDIGLEPSFYVFLFVPLINILMLFMLTFLNGEERKSDFISF